jgi:hypothetical protein
MVHASKWPSGLPTATLPMKVKAGELATSSNLCWQFCGDEVSFQSALVRKVYSGTKGG